ncbi:MAG: hypothetical protein ABR927_12420 [Bacteroidales bacterium]|jgi:DNA-binding transcriptional MocR family regulator
METEYSCCSSRTKSSEIRELLKYTRIEEVISFAGGLPDPMLFPVDDIKRLSTKVLHEKGMWALQYGPTKGEPEFVSSLINHMTSFGEPAAEENICR